VSRRRHIGWRTKYAAALLKLRDVPYEHAKLMHEDQIISLYQVHHNRQHAIDKDAPLDGIDVDHFSNLEPMLRPEHKDRFPRDNAAAKKVTRIVRDNDAAVSRLLRRDTGDLVRQPRKAIIRNRGFDKTRTRKFSGKVVPREARRS
jgi:hypothetical protein